LAEQPNLTLEKYSLGKKKRQNKLTSDLVGSSDPAIVVSCSCSWRMYDDKDGLPDSEALSELDFVAVRKILLVFSLLRNR